MKIKMLYKIILCVMTVFMMAFIFRMSAMEADESSQLSTSVGYTIGGILVEGFEEMPADTQEEYVEEIEHPLRKLAHFTEFMVLGFLLLLDVFVFTKLNGVKRSVVALVLGLAYAASDELHQLLVSGRSCELRDVLIDVGGVVSGCVIASLVILIVRYARNRPAKDKE
ncbi:MAG: VanZ family protein [Lachnospiraceae bacterium]|nr:VanZ family protein [Lachnospiraceae bacterium]